MLLVVFLPRSRKTRRVDELRIVGRKVQHPFLVYNTGHRPSFFVATAAFKTKDTAIVQPPNDLVWAQIKAID